MPVLSRAVPSVVLAVALLAGCTGQSPASGLREPAESTHPASRAIPTPTPSTPTPPEPPTALERTDEVGAAAAAEHFAALYAYTLNSGDVTAWDQMSHANCAFCAGIKEDALDAQLQGKRYEGGHITLTDVAVLGRDDLIGGYPVEARYTQVDEVLRSADGAVLSRTEGNAGTVRIDTLPDSSGWKILAVVVESD